MPITRKALAVANKLLEIVDELPREERDDVVMLLIETMQQDRPDLPEKLTIRERLLPEKPRLSPMNRRKKHAWITANPEIIANLPYPRKRELTVQERNNLKRNVLALMNKRGFTARDVEKAAIKKGYALSAASVNNIVSGRSKTYTQMILHATAAGLGVSVEQLLKKHA